VESELTESYGQNIDSNILKAGHHGSKTASSMEFVQLVSPKISVISLGANNTYKHPHKETLATLQESGSEIMRTDYHGDIKCWSDGHDFGCEQEKL